MSGYLLVQCSLYGISGYGRIWGGISADISASDGPVYDGGVTALPGSGGNQRICICEALLRCIHRTPYRGGYPGKPGNQLLRHAPDQCSDDDIPVEMQK